MRVIIEMTQEEYNKYEQYSKEYNFPDAEAYILQCVDEDHLLCETGEIKITN